MVDNIRPNIALRTYNVVSLNAVALYDVFQYSLTAATVSQSACR